MPLYVATSFIHRVFHSSESVPVSLTADDLLRIVGKLSFAALHELCIGGGECSVLAQAEIFRRLIALLYPEVTDAQRFLDALHTFNAVITGNFVLTLIDPLQRQTFSSIDVIVGREEYGAFKHWLEVHESSYEEDRPDQILGLHKDGYHDAVLMTCAGGYIRVIQSVARSPLFTIPHYYSSHLMNYISSDRICVAYPTLTYARQGILVTASAATTTYTVQRREELFPFAVGCSPQVSCGDVVRSFTDDFASTIHFRDDVVHPVDHDVVYWRIGGPPCSLECGSEQRSVVAL